MTDAGMRLAASASASSGVCLYLNVSRAPGATDGGGFAPLAAAGGANFFTAGAADAGALVLAAPSGDASPLACAPFFA